SIKRLKKILAIGGRNRFYKKRFPTWEVDSLATEARHCGGSSKAGELTLGPSSLGPWRNARGPSETDQWRKSDSPLGRWSRSIARRRTASGELASVGKTTLETRTRGVFKPAVRAENSTFNLWMTC